MKPPVRFAIVGAAVGTIVLSIYAWNYWPVCRLRAVVSDHAPEPRLHERPITLEEKTAFAQVLAKHGEPYAERSETILITPRLYFDTELRWNNTSKK